MDILISISGVQYPKNILKISKKGKLHLSISIIINCCPNGAPMLEPLQRVSVNQHINGRPFNYWHTPSLLPMNHYQPNITISLPKSFHLFCLVNFVQKNLHFPFQSKSVSTQIRPCKNLLKLEIHMPVTVCVFLWINHVKCALIFGGHQLTKLQSSTEKKSKKRY